MTSDAGSSFDGINASIGDNNASASDIMASIPVDAGASSDGPGALTNVIDAPIADASSAGDEGSSTDCIVSSINERNELPALAVGAEPSSTSSSTLANADSIVTAGLGAERDEPTNGAQRAKSTELCPIHSTGAADAKMEMAVNLDTMLFVNQSSIILSHLDKRANVPLHAVTQPFTNN